MQSSDIATRIGGTTREVVTGIEVITMQITTWGGRNIFSECVNTDQNNSGMPCIHGRDTIGSDQRDRESIERVLAASWTLSSPNVSKCSSMERSSSSLSSPGLCLTV